MITFAVTVMAGAANTANTASDAGMALATTSALVAAVAPATPAATCATHNVTATTAHPMCYCTTQSCLKCSILEQDKIKI